jgi:hypothetical protein
MGEGNSIFGGGGVAEGGTSFRWNENNMKYFKNNNDIGLETMCVISINISYYHVGFVYVPFHSKVYRKKYILRKKNWLDFETRCDISIILLKVSRSRMTSL